MNAKLCKYLRKTAKAIGETRKLPERQLVKLQLTKEQINDNHPFRGTAFNNPETVRGLYRHLKKQARTYFGNKARTNTVGGGTP